MITAVQNLTNGQQMDKPGGIFLKLTGLYED